MAYADPEVRKQRDRERFRRRTEERRAAGLCPRCGARPPASERTVCDGCAAKRNRASRAQDARLRKAGLPRRDPAKAKTYERKRAGRQAAERRAAGICVPCGKAPAAPERTACGECLEKRRAADRARYAAGKAAGKLYGGADPAAKRKSGRARSRRRQKERKEAGLCIRCGGSVHDGLSRCAPCAAIEEATKCPERKNARSRRFYWKRRAAGLCTACGAPSQGAARCAPCAKRSYEGSAHFRGMPLYTPSYAVFLRGATLITSNLPFDEWTETFGTERLTGALLDRLTHHVNILEMNGDSYRLSQSRARRNSADS